MLVGEVFITPAIDASPDGVEPSCDADVSGLDHANSKPPLVLRVKEATPHFENLTAGPRASASSVSLQFAHFQGSGIKGFWSPLIFNDHTWDKIQLVSRELLIGLLSGCVGAIITGWATIFFQRRNERARQAEKILFDVYMMLLEANARHFWIASREVNQKDPKPEMVANFHDASWRIADQMRTIDHLPEAREILRVLFSLGYRSEVDRATALAALVKKLGQRVNPRYDVLVHEIETENEALMVSDMDEYFRRQRKIQPL